MTVTSLLLLSLGLAGAPASAPDPLADAYVDGTYGFSIRPPRGWQLIRQRVPEKRGTTLLRMVKTLGGGLSHQIVFKHTTTTKAVPLNEMLKKMAHSLELEFSNVHVHAQQVQQIAGRPGSYLSATLSRSGLQILRLQAVIEIAPRDYFVLLYNGPAALRKQTEPLFDRVLDSLTLMGNRLDRAALNKALDAGAGWIADLARKGLPKMPEAVRFFRVDLDGKPMGFVKVTSRPHHWKGNDGVQVVEEGWMFEKNGQARRSQSRMFLSNDLAHERWQTSITTWQAAGKKTEQFENAFEEGLRDHAVLLTDQTTSLSWPLKQNPPLEVPRTYISRVLIRLLPRLVGGLDQPRRYAFTSFDHQRIGLMVRVVDIKGPAKLSPEETARVHRLGRGLGLFRIDESEGLVTTPSSLYCDGAGEMLLMKARNMTMWSEKPKRLEALFATRVAQADRAMKRLEQAYEQNQSRFLRRGPGPR